MAKSASLSKRIQGVFLLLITAFIWGFAFVAQRWGMSFMDPFFFNGIRFLVGWVFLLVFFGMPKTIYGGKEKLKLSLVLNPKSIVVGVVLFLAATFQQSGLQYTTAGKAGFLTGLYVIIVPILGLTMGQKAHPFTWLGAVIGVVGTYLLTAWQSNSNFNQLGDMLVLISAFFWAVHVVLVGQWVREIGFSNLSVGQYLVVGVLSIMAGLSFETINLSNVISGIGAILYAGIASVGIGYTLQVVAQRYVPSSIAAIVLSSESVFAVIGGWWILGERLNLIGIVGCCLIFVAMIIAQFGNN